MEEVKKLACPSCGADLPQMAADQKLLTCDYCGSQCRIEEPEPTQEPGHTRVSVVLVSSSWGGGDGWLDYVLSRRLMMLVAGTVLSLFLMGLYWCMHETRTGRPQGQSPHAYRKGHGVRKWLRRNGASGPGSMSPRPLAADMNGDGTEDVVGWIRGKEKGKAVGHLVALDGRNMKPLWRTPLAVHSSGTSGGPTLYLAGKYVLATLNGAVFTYALDTGHPVWKSQVSDRVWRVSLDGETLYLDTIDGAVTALSLVTGKEEDDADSTPQGAVLRPDRIPRNQGPYQSRRYGVRSGAFDRLFLRRVYCPVGQREKVVPQEADSLDAPVRRRFRSARRRGRRRRGRRKRARGRRRAQPIRCTAETAVAYGTHTVGSRVPTLVGFSPEDDEEQWRTRLGPATVLRPPSRDPHVAFRGNRVAVLYKQPGQPARVTLLSLEEGTVAWDRAIPDSERARPVGVSLTDRRVYARIGLLLWVAEARHGKQLHRFRPRLSLAN